jgi:diguanylate cyclase (GGDEF)-like protein
MLDLDRFKEVNDTLGHPAGDALLKAVTGRLRTCVRERDTIARLGGDEFAILASVTDAPAEAAALAKRVNDAVSAPFDLEGHRVTVGASIGIALAPQDGSDPDRLLKKRGPSSVSREERRAKLLSVLHGGRGAAHASPAGICARPPSTASWNSIASR